MATPDVIDAMHRNITIMTGTGAAVALLGFSSYFMSYEYKDFDRVELQGQDRMEKTYSQRKKISLIIRVIAGFFYISGIVLITLGICLWRDEREEQAQAIPSLIQQIRNADAQPSVNEPAILAGLSSAVLLAGAVMGALHFHKHEDYGWIGATLYAAGWLAQSFAAAMNNKSINSLKANRLAWTLPGAAGIVLGSFILPWQLHENYVSGPAHVVHALGLVAFTIGTAYVTDPPQLESSST